MPCVFNTQNKKQEFNYCFSKQKHVPVTQYNGQLVEKWNIKKFHEVYADTLLAKRLSNFLLLKAPL